MKSEQIKQSLESQLKMARPQRHEVKRVPLTPKEKAFLGEIMDKAVAAEKAGELKEALDLYTDYKNELLKIKRGARIIKAKTPEGNEITFDLEKELECWKEFYDKHEIDWVALPNQIQLTVGQVEEIKRLIKEYRFDWMIIIPEGLADTSENYQKLIEKIAKNAYRDIKVRKAGGLKALKNKSDKLRIIVTKAAEEIHQNKLFKKTLGKSMDDLEKGIFKETGLSGIDVATYLIMRTEYSDTEGSFLDENSHILLTEHEPLMSGYVPRARRSGAGSISFSVMKPAKKYDNTGCRLAKIFEIE